MTLPLVTVAICTYNGERYLEETLTSVLAQTYPYIEVVIVDDGSSDSTISIIRKYAQDDTRIRWFSRKNAGLPASRNFAFAQAHGEWIAIIDQDDLCYPERLTKQVAVAFRYPSAGLVFCDTNYINETGQIIGNHFSSFNLPDSFIPKGIASDLLLRKGCYVDSEACFIKRTTVNRLGPLDVTLRYACDYEYFIRAGFEHDFAYTQDKLSAWRIHGKQETAINPRRFKESRVVLKRFFLHAGLSLGTRGSIALNVGKSLVAEARHVVSI